MDYFTKMSARSASPFGTLLPSDCTLIFSGFTPFVMRYARICSARASEVRLATELSSAVPPAYATTRTEPCDCFTVSATDDRSLFASSERSVLSFA